MSYSQLSEVASTGSSQQSSGNISGSWDNLQLEPSAVVKKLLPYRSHIARIDGLRMHYIDEGEGEVVFLLHGNPTWCFYYRSLIDVLRKKFRVIAPDFLGCGLSDHPTDRHFRAADRISHLEQLIDHLGIKKFSLVMHDWGGSIGTGLAIRRVNAIERLVYLNTTLTETESLPGIIKRAAKPFIGKFLTKQTMRFLKLTTSLGVTKKLSKEVKNSYYFPYRSSARRTAIWDFVADIPFDNSHPSYSNMMELAAELPKLKHVPVQIVWGLKDPCFHRQMLDKVAQHFPQAEILEIPDAGHLVLEDAPELACSTIYSFLLDPRAGKTAILNTSDNFFDVQTSEQNPLYASLLKLAENSENLSAVMVPSYLGGSVRYQHLRYKEFSELVHKYQRGLVELGLRSGDKVLMLVKPGVDFLALSYAVLGRGAVPAFLDPGMGIDNIEKCVKTLRPDVFIGSPLAHILRLFRRKMFATIRFKVVASDLPLPYTTNLSILKRFSARPLKPVKAGRTAFIAFTSGATGTPKGVIYTSDMIQAQLEIFKQEFGLQAGKKDLPLLPIFSLFTCALGICSVYPPMNPSKPLNIQPERILKIINDCSIDYSFGSPTLWKKIAEYCLRCRENLPSLSKVLMAGAPVPPETLDQVRKILVNGEAYTPYGATEALPVTLISATEINAIKPQAANTGELGTLVGRSIAEIELRVIQETEGNIDSISKAKFCEVLEIGEVIVKGENVSPEYFELNSAMQAAKIIDGNSFWHRMGDMGYLDSDGRLYFCGRKAHVIKTKEKTFYSVPAEKVFNQHDKVARSALIGLETGEAAIVIEPLPQFWPETDETKQTLANTLRILGKNFKASQGIEKVYYHRSFPVDARHNAKIFRDRLAEWAKSEQFF
ncbi:MAG: alpha/beta fold hydrolase [Bdellovibrionales bacterium]|nr:alpha/beta fold hydrolase [Bdellovibrionales bacterium]